MYNCNLKYKPLNRKWWTSYQIIAFRTCCSSHLGKPKNEDSEYFFSWVFPQGLKEKGLHFFFLFFWGGVFVCKILPTARVDNMWIISGKEYSVVSPITPLACKAFHIGETEKCKLWCWHLRALAFWSTDIFVFWKCIQCGSKFIYSSEYYPPPPRGSTVFMGSSSGNNLTSREGRRNVESSYNPMHLYQERNPTELNKTNFEVKVQKTRQHMQSTVPQVWTVYVQTAIQPNIPEYAIMYPSQFSSLKRQ